MNFSEFEIQSTEPLGTRECAAAGTILNAAMHHKETCTEQKKSCPKTCLSVSSLLMMMIMKNK